VRRRTTLILGVFLGLGVVSLLLPCALQRWSTAACPPKTRSDIMALECALEEYAARNGGQYPDSLHALVEPGARGDTILRQTWLPKDPWGREYLYELPNAQHADPRIWTCGKDGLPGGGGDDADLGNWMMHR
jgi:general secretion pathway protein G